MTKYFILTLAVLTLLASCQSVDLSEYLEEKEEEYEITFNLGKYTITDFDDAETDSNAAKSPMKKSKKAASELGSILNFAVFSGSEKIKTVNQKSSDSDFGTITVALPQGDYQIVAMVHNCSGNATITSPQKVTFPNNKVTDTFSTCTSLTVSKNESVDISLDRVVSMVRLTLEDAIPDDVAQMQFYYTGGSSTLNPESGYGCVNSRQTEIRDVAARTAGQIFEVYTFPHDESDELSMTITALDASGSEYAIKTLDAVPVVYQKVTNHSMTFFSGGSSSQNSFTLYGDDEWKGEIEY